MTRQIIVVDVETTGLDHRFHDVVEVAWWNLSTGTRGAFIPMHSPSDVLSRAEIEALRVNRYLDRIPGQPQDNNGDLGFALNEQLAGNTLAGSNPAFDAAFLVKLFKEKPYEDFCGDPWHHRLLDLSAYAAGVLGLHPGGLLGLAAVCDALDIVNRGPHTAAGDVDATGRCFLELMNRAGATT